MSLLVRAFVVALGSAFVALGRYHWRSAERRAEFAVALRGRAGRGFGALSWRIAGVVTVIFGLFLVGVGVWPYGST
jgi:hypothetical protein